MSVPGTIPVKPPLGVGLTDNVYWVTVPAGGVNEIFIEDPVTLDALKPVGGDNIVLYVILDVNTESVYAVLAYIFIVYIVPLCNPVIL